MRRLAGAVPVAATILLAAQPAAAHIVGARLGDFYAGALHPLTDPQDVVLWTALGLLAGSLGAPRARWIVPLFPLGLIGGLAIGLGFSIPAPGLLADASLTVAVGLLMAAAISLPGWALGAAAMGIGLLRGIANAGAAGPQTNDILLAAGLGFAGYAFVTIVTAVTAVFCRAPGGVSGGAPKGWQIIAVRAVGSWIAAIGLMMGGFAYAT